MPHRARFLRSDLLLLLAALALPVTAHAQAVAQPGPQAAPLPGLQAAPALPPVPGAPATFADLAEAQIETVVNISTSQPMPDALSDLPDMPDLPPGSPFEDFFREFRERQESFREPLEAQGSGFIIDPQGYIVTNSHVVEGAESIAVTLHDGTQVDATLVGSDPLTDLALVKIDPDRPLRAANWGDSEQVAVGDWVMAIGNPFGLGGTVTAGILSARARDINQGPYDEFLQTDASINRGNSGGPLFNMAGEVVGVNAAIFSPTGGSVGIGFAIPSTLAAPVIADLREHGSVRRGWLGVQVQVITDDIAESLGLPVTEGALVTSVEPGGPAARAGIRPGDVIRSFAGQEVARMRALPKIVAAAEIGAKAPVTLLRNGKTVTLDVTVGALEPEALALAPSAEPPPDAVSTGTVLGLQLAPLSPGLRDAFGIGEDVRGVVVTELAEDSPAAGRGLDVGDVIVEAGQQPVDAPEDVAAAVEKAKAEGKSSILVLLNRSGDLVFVPIPVEPAG